MTDDQISILITGVIVLALLVYNILLISRLIRAFIRKDRGSYLKIAPLLPIRHNTVKNQKAMTEGQITTLAIMAIFVITLACISLGVWVISYVS